MRTEKQTEENHFSKDLPTVAVLIVTRNRRDMLLQVLSQVRQLAYPMEKLGIFIVDGASTDGTVEKVRQEYPDARIILITKMMQIAACENIGIKEILKAEREYKYIWMLDDDAEIETQTLMPLVEASEQDSSIGLIGSAVYEPDNRDRLITAGVRIVWKRTGLTYNRPAPEDAENLFDVEIMPACSSLVRTALYGEGKVGLWDEHFWMYWPDVDWGLRALRKGYRVCCQGMSRVWHRNWAEAKRYFFTPYTVHSSVRGAMLFYLRHCPVGLRSSVRKYVLKCYLRGAFENFTARPNMARAYDEGVHDFLKGHFGEKDLSSWGDSSLSPIEDICLSLSEEIPENPRVLLNQFASEDEKAKIKGAFQKHFKGVRWTEISPKTGPGGPDPAEPLSDYLFYHFPRLLLRLLTFFKRDDVVVSPVAVLEYNIAAARYTVLLEPSLNGCMRKNRMFKGFCDFFRMIITGIRTAYIDLPRALENCDILREAIEAYSNLPQPSPPGLDDSSARVM